MRFLLLVLVIAAPTAAWCVGDGSDGTLCNRPSSSNPLLALVPEEKHEAETVQGDDEERQCNVDGDCTVVAGVCNHCWITVNSVSRGHILHRIQMREGMESFYRPNLGAAVAYCGEGLCRLKTP
jgi:hypothetical protein